MRVPRFYKSVIPSNGVGLIIILRCSYIRRLLCHISTSPIIAFKMLSLLLPFTVLPFLTTAHFQLVFPPSRGTADEGQATYPCGGYTQTQNRTSVPLTSIPISLELGHTKNLITVVLAIGNNVGSNFNTIISPTVQEYGPGNLCWSEGAILLPSDLNLTEGTNGTVQVITNSRDGGGLYNVSPPTLPSRDVMVNTCLVR